jgi:biopolymer transport protein ExbD
MVPKQLSEWMLQATGAAIAGLFLILALYLAADTKPPAHGVRLILLSEPTSADCGDSRDILLHWGEDGEVWVNEDRVGTSQAPAEVARIMETRAEKVVFLLPDENISVQDVADLTARLNASVDDLHIGLVTNRQVKSMTRTEHGFTWTPIGCMGWPRSAFPELR